MTPSSTDRGRPGRKFADIIERIEYFRNYKGLNKSRFSAEIGMKPQTYNNFIGAQGSKPNVELIHGIVSRFSVNPTWLLTGKGAMMLEGAEEVRPAYPGAPMPMQVAERDEAIRTLERRLGTTEARLDEMERRVRLAEQAPHPLLAHLNRVLMHFLEVDPGAAAEEMRQLNARVEEKLARY